MIIAFQLGYDKILENVFYFTYNLIFTYILSKWSIDLLLVVMLILAYVLYSYFRTRSRTITANKPIVENYDNLETDVTELYNRQTKYLELLDIQKPDFLEKMFKYLDNKIVLSMNKNEFVYIDNKICYCHVYDMNIIVLEDIGPEITKTWDFNKQNKARLNGFIKNYLLDKLTELFNIKYNVREYECMLSLTTENLLTIKVATVDNTPPANLNTTTTPTDVEQLQCPICKQNERNIVVNCGHTYCAECVKNIKHCSICRCEIYRQQNIFF
jgi:hypothetical protein